MNQSVSQSPDNTIIGWSFRPEKYKKKKKKKKNQPFLLPVLLFLAAQNLPKNWWLDWNVPFKTGVCVVRVHMPGRLTMNIYETFYFYNQIYLAQNDSFWESKVIIIKNSHTYFWKCNQISIISQSYTGI